MHTPLPSPSLFVFVPALTLLCPFLLSLSVSLFTPTLNSTADSSDNVNVCGFFRLNPFILHLQNPETSRRVTVKVANTQNLHLCFVHVVLCCTVNKTSVSSLTLLGHSETARQRCLDELIWAAVYKKMCRVILILPAAERALLYCHLQIVSRGTSVIFPWNHLLVT